MGYVLPGRGFGLLPYLNPEPNYPTRNEDLPEVEVRPSTSFVNSVPTPKTLSVGQTADGATVPIVYGRQAVNGYVIAQKIYGGHLYVAVGWCLGEISGVEKVFINNEAVPAGVSVRHYRGTTDQGVDPWLAAAIAGYSDTCVITSRGQSVGLAYSVFRIASSAISGTPRFSAILQGKLVYDPSANAGGDPYFDDNVLDVDFTDGGTDQSNDSQTVTLSGDAVINSSGLQLDGTGDYATISDNATMELGTGELCLEIVATASSVAAGTATLISHGAAADLGLRLQRDADGLELSISSDGSTYDIANAVSVGTITTAEFKFTLERIGDELVAFLDGEEQARIETTDGIFDSTADWQIGAYSGGDEWAGSVQAIRIKKGGYRYGAEHDALSSPFADSGTYAAGVVYSDNFALHAADIARSTLYGNGATVSGLADSRAWCLENLVEGDLVPQGIGGMTLVSSRPAEYWISILADYANCLWMATATGIEITPDREAGAENPSGQEYCVNGDFDSATGWTADTGWSIGSGVATVDGTQVFPTSLYRVVNNEAGVLYAVKLVISSISAGGIGVVVDEAEAIAEQSSAGTYYGLVTTPAADLELFVSASPDAVGTVSEVSMRRVFWLQDNYLPDSLTMTGPSERNTPNGVKVTHREPSSDTPNWPEGFGQDAIPATKTGEVDLIETTLNMPGYPTFDQAQNKAVRKTARMDKRLAASFVTTDTGILQRKGSFVQISRVLRGVDLQMWVEDVEMVDYGRYRVTGERYSAGHYSRELNYRRPDPVNYSEAVLNLLPDYYWTLIQGGVEPSSGVNDEIIDEVGGWNLDVLGTYTNHEPEYFVAGPNPEPSINLEPEYTWAASGDAELKRVEDASVGQIKNQPGLSFGAAVGNYSTGNGEFKFTIRGAFTNGTTVDYDALIKADGADLVVQVPGQASSHTIVNALDVENPGGAYLSNVVVVVEGEIPYGSSSSDVSAGMVGRVYVNNVLVYTTAAQVNPEWLYLRSVEMIPTQYGQLQHGFIKGGMLNDGDRAYILTAFEGDAPGSQEGEEEEEEP